MTQMTLDVPAVDYIDVRGDPGWDDVAKFSREWRLRYAAWWLAVYPDADEGTRRNLAALAAAAGEEGETR